MTDLVNRLAEELAQRWQAGDRPIVEEYLARYPQVADCPEAAAELIYEELCLRQELGEPANPHDVLERFPQWRTQLQVLIQFHDFLQPMAAQVTFPAPGETVGDFTLSAELGRGAHGRVYLATQASLADRPVVLKFVPRSGQEHLALARLQHTHIVPLYSMVDDPARGWRALCMPYFGGTTLAHVLQRLEAIPLENRSGKDLPQALADGQPAQPPRIPVEGPACQFLARVSYMRGICWLGVCLAEALQYTHERGLLHLDLKPSNILWAADGQPMLLDLHLAKPPIAAGAPGPTWIGGTPAYMAPEQRLAMAAVEAGENILTAVDGRADLFALGLVLVECLAGCLPRRGQRIAPWLVQRNPLVDRKLAGILEKCLADEPRNRHPSATALADALRRRLADKPRRGPLVRAVARLFSQTQAPRRFTRTLFSVALAAVIGVSLALAYVHWQDSRARVSLARAERRAAAGELHQVVERLRAIHGTDGSPDASTEGLAAICQAMWQKRHAITRQLDSPDGGESAQVHNDLLDLAVLFSDLGVRLAGEGEARRAHRMAIEIIDQAEALFGPSPRLESERQIHAAALEEPRTQ